MRTLLRPALALLALFSLGTGLLYPLLLTAVIGLMFPDQARGSLLTAGGRVVGSRLVGQPFEGPGYFHGRPSATSPYPYNAASSSGSNLGPSSAALLEAVKARVAALRAEHPEMGATPIPIDLVTTSGSGLDPHLSPAAAAYQIRRVARVRGRSVEQLRALVAQHTEGRLLGLWGEPRVNVLTLNLALDQLDGPRS
ncbi:MAG: potassium-transporting ATPase subunit KdpC [Polyangiaceae bacterium]|jgi:K+-transporting ATPase ATPase C chain|nr:potassium-transporting ATPase subunit KdpC [Polyangiaceae bacterium]